MLICNKSSKIAGVFQFSGGKRLIKNFAFLFIGRIASNVLAFVAVAYIARILSPKGFGILSFAQAVLAYAIVISDLGLRNLGIREIARLPEKRHEYISNILTFRLFLALLGYLLLTVIVCLIHKNRETETIILIFGISLFFSATLMDWIFIGLEKMEFSALAETVRYLVYITLIFIFIKNPDDLIVVAIIYVIATSVPAILLYRVYQRNHASLSLTVNLSFWNMLFKEAMPIGVAMILTQAYVNIDIIMLEFMKGNQIVGWYSAAVRLVAIAAGLGSLFPISIYPMVAKAHKESVLKSEKVMNLSSKIISATAIPITVAGAIIASHLVSLIYGAGYSESIIGFQILVGGIFFILMNHLIERFLIICGRQRQFMKVVGLGCLTNIILNLLLIPKFDLVGASIATLSTQFMIFAFGYYYANSVINMDLIKYLPKPLLASVCMGAILWANVKSLQMSQNVIANTVMALILSTFIYFLSMILIKGFTKHEYEALKKLLK
ncbi:hypothetical protein DRQ11_07225 [candidate division KSB1 bacterium]|nr:MAG: hypothetical protein DRQ11_07225 [candidate division KSB1 bacterium]